MAINQIYYFFFRKKSAHSPIDEHWIADDSGTRLISDGGDYIVTDV